MDREGKPPSGNGVLRYPTTPSVSGMFGSSRIQVRQILKPQQHIRHPVALCNSVSALMADLDVVTGVATAVTVVTVAAVDKYLRAFRAGTRVRASQDPAAVKGPYRCCPGQVQV